MQCTGKMEKKAGNKTSLVCENVTIVRKNMGNALV